MEPNLSENSNSSQDLIIETRPQDVQTKSSAIEVIKNSLNSNEKLTHETENLLLQHGFDTDLLDVLRHKTETAPEIEVDSEKIGDNDPRSETFFTGPNVKVIGRMKIRLSYSTEIGFFIHVIKDNGRKYAQSRISFPIGDCPPMIKYLRRVRKEIMETPKGKLIRSLRDFPHLALLNRKNRQFWSPEVSFITPSKKIRVRAELSTEQNYYVVFLKERFTEKDYGTFWIGPTISMSLAVLKQFLACIENLYIESVLLSTKDV